MLETWRRKVYKKITNLHLQFGMTSRVELLFNFESVLQIFVLFIMDQKDRTKAS